MSTPTVKLNDGHEIPLLGLGTWQSKPHEVAKAVEIALKAGYKHIDCAQAYGNEDEVGEGIKASGVPRSEIFITSKVWSTWHRRVEEALDETLKKLGTDYVDLYLMHWPVPLNPNGNHPNFPTRPDGTRDIDFGSKIADTWADMEKLVAKGKVRSIGVSNFSEMKLEEILPTAKIIPAVDQLELHPYNPQHKLAEYLTKKGIILEAYSPLGSSNAPLSSDEVVVEIAKKHSVEPTHVLCAYHVVSKRVCLPKSVTESRIIDNLKGTLTAYAKLDKDDIAKLDSLAAAGKQKRFVTPPWGVPLGFEHWPQ